MRRGRSRLVAVVLCLSCGPTAVFGQTPAHDSTAQPGQPKQNLAGAVVDPTAEIKTLTLQYKYAPSYWGMDADGEEIDLQMGIPHRAFGKANILRVTIPYLTSTPVGNPGLTDVAVFDNVLFTNDRGTQAVGAESTFAPDKGNDTDMFAIGPAIGAVLKSHKWLYGVFSQNLFSFGDIASSQLQPILAYTANAEWSFSLGDMQLTYDWKKGRFVNIPASAQANYIGSVAAQPIRLFFNPQYNFKNELGTRRWNLIGGMALIVR